MKHTRNSSPILLSTAIALAVGFLCAVENLSAQPEAASPDDPLQVVTTIPDYAWVAQEIGGDRVAAESISHGDQDAHFVRPKPSFQTKLRSADLFITTGLDLELWAPTLLDAAGNRNVLEGAPGYVAAWTGIELLDKPTTLSRSEGDVHVYGNPHIHTDPLNMVIVARNVLAGLEKVDPANADYYRDREVALEDRLHRRLFGDELVDLLGGDTLARLARSGKLEAFLESKEYPSGSGSTLDDRLGGWLKQTEPIRGLDEHVARDRVQDPEIERRRLDASTDHPCHRVRRSLEHDVVWSQQKGVIESGATGRVCRRHVRCV